LSAAIRLPDCHLIAIPIRGTKAVEDPKTNAGGVVGMAAVPAVIAEQFTH